MTAHINAQKDETPTAEQANEVSREQAEHALYQQGCNHEQK